MSELAVLKAEPPDRARKGAGPAKRPPGVPGMRAGE